MSELQEKIGEIQKRADREIRDAKATVELASKLPQGAVPEHVHAGIGFCADAIIKYKVRTREEALRVLALYEPVPLAFVRSGSVTVKPADALTDRDRSGEVNTEILPVVWWHQPWEHRAESAIEFWAMLGGSARVNVDVIITEDPAHVIADHTREGYGEHGRIVSYHWRHGAGFPNGGEMVRYSSGQTGTCGKRLAWFPTAEGCTLATHLEVGNDADDSVDLLRNELKDQDA